MMLRLVLVGMVAALGVTIPGGSNRGGWLKTAGRWANSAVADLDLWNADSSASQPRRIVATRHGCEQCRLARAALAERELRAAKSQIADSTKIAVIKTAAGSEKPTGENHRVPPADSVRATTVAFEPIEVGDDFYANIAFELNRIAEGINVAHSATMPSATLARSEPIVLRDGIEPELPAVLCGVSDEDDVEPLPIAVASQPGEENDPTAFGTFVSGESGDDAGRDETADSPISGAVTAPIVAAGIQPVAANDGTELFEGIACQTHFNDDDAGLFAEGPSPTVFDDSSILSVVTEPATPLIPAAPAVVVESTPHSQVRVTAIPWPVFAPVEPMVQPTTRVAQEQTVPWPVFAPTNATNDPNLAPESRSSATASGQGSSSQAGLSQAVDLTRQAMRAWMSVLVGSAPVEVTAR